MAPSKKTLQNFLNIMPAVLYEYLQCKDENSRFLYLSPSTQEILGYPREYLMEDVGRFWEIIHPDDREMLRVDDRTFNGEFYSSEVRIIWPSGEVRWIRFRSRPVSGNEDGFLIWNGCIVDISDLKQKMEKLRDSEIHFRALTELLPEAVFEADIEANLTYANQHAFQISGYTKQDLDNGLNGIELLVPEDRKRAKENLAKIFQGRDVGINEYKAIRKDGSIFPVLMHSEPLLDRGGAIKGVIGIIVDITQRKQAEDELNQYRYHLEELVSNRTNELKQQKIHLEEVNVALKVILQQCEKAKKEVEKNISRNIEKLVYPYLEKLKETISEPEGITYIDIIRSNLTEISSAFSTDLLTKFSMLTPAEIEIADLIRRGKANKEIARLLRLAPETIATHRKNIRKKLALTNTKINLRTALSTQKAKSK